MPFPTTPVLDDFDRPNEGPPMTGWSAFFDSGLAIVSNECAPTASPNIYNSAYWNQQMTEADVEAWVEIPVIPDLTPEELGVWARTDPSVEFSGYQVVWYTDPVDGATMQLFVWDGTPPVEIIPLWHQELSSGDALGIRCLGQKIEAWVRRSDIWINVASGNDATYSGAAPNDKLALSIYAQDLSCRLDNFGGGISHPMEISGPERFITR